jgi:hypothetical protein
MTKLIVNPGTDQSWEIPLPAGVTVLGSDPALEFAIAHDSVSPAHCEISVTDGKVKIRDLGSTCGTFINHAAVTESLLAPGQLVQLGEVDLQFVSDEAGAGAPPVPRRIPTALPADSMAQSRNARCKYHPGAVATWHCDRCQAYFCDLCVNSRQTGGTTRHLCRKCGNDCTPVAVHYEAPVEENFYELLPRAFSYPFHGGGAVLLAAGTVLLAVLHVAGSISRYVPVYGMVVGLILGVFGTGYLFNYAKQIVLSSAQGGDLPPDWPDAGEWLEEIVQPCGEMVALVLLTFGPAMILRWWHPLGDKYAELLFIAAAAAGALFAPMGMLMLAMFDSIAALNPVPIIQSILRIPKPYLLAAATFESVLCAYVAIDALARSTGLPPVLTGLVTGFVELYAMSVGMRILGLLYRTHQERLGWF